MSVVRLIRLWKRNCCREIRSTLFPNSLSFSRNFHLCRRLFIPRKLPLSKLPNAGGRNGSQNRPRSVSGYIPVMPVSSLSKKDWDMESSLTAGILTRRMDFIRCRLNTWMVPSSGVIPGWSIIKLIFRTRSLRSSHSLCWNTLRNYAGDLPHDPCGYLISKNNISCIVALIQFCLA